MTCAQGLLRLLWGGGRSWSATGLMIAVAKYQAGNDFAQDSITAHSDDQNILTINI